MASFPPGGSPLEPGYRLDRYELLCMIGEGGMASVWLARLNGKRGFEKLVAIKTILPEHAADSVFQKMFLDEARIAAGIDHPNVARILDLGEQRDLLYLVMEYVQGDSLQKIRRTLAKNGTKLPVAILLRILSDTCAGLHAAHELVDGYGQLRGIVHRDVSPQNILVNEQGIAKLIDFGVAKAKGRLSGDTSAGLAKGKIRYMAPEQAVGRAVDRRADVWSIGAVAYDLLEGVPPYDGVNDLARLHELVAGGAPKPFTATVPRAVEAVIMQALTRDLDSRYATASELRIALEEAMIISSLRASTDDVASYLHKTLGRRAEARKQTVDQALAIASERSRLRSVLEFNDRTPGTLDGAFGFPLPTVPRPRSKQPGLTSRAPDKSSPTIGTATVDSIIAHSHPLRDGWPKRLAAIAVGLVMAVVTIGLSSNRSTSGSVVVTNSDRQLPRLGSVNASLEPSFPNPEPSSLPAVPPPVVESPSAPPPAKRAPTVATPKVIAHTAKSAPKAPILPPKNTFDDDTIQ